MREKLADVIPLRKEEAAEVVVQWTPAERADPGAYRKLLELLFLPRVEESQEHTEAA
ncbi:hypothetical protein ACFWAP_00285 [Streptomyces goshikiensis]|uniref:hypothetical protein n=1 Tax=Streptomyces goshikiensis TaxID=1942 RepID=UPI0036697482